MKHIFNLFLLSLLVLTLNSCKKDEGKLPAIEFKTGGNYVSSDVNVAIGDTVLIGIHAEKTEEEDVLKHFNVSVSVDGATPTSIHDEDLIGADQDQFDVDYFLPGPIVAGQTWKVINTITNRDGLTNHVDLTLTAN